MLKAYFYYFVNYEQNKWAWLLSIGKFAYNNSKNSSISHTLFKLNYSYHPQVSFKNKYNICSKSSSANTLVIELRELMNVCCQNLLYTQDFWKEANDKRVKPESYALGEKIQLNSKHIKIKQDHKLKAKFLDLSAFYT